MRKWTYLVAVLLMAGTSTSLLTSCIDNDEPAGITDLRGAKAELLRAKAAVEQAEAAIKTAQVKWYEAEAEIKNQEAEQEKLKTSWLEAQYQAQKDSLEIETQKYVERQKKLLIEAQQATAEANAEYQKALAEIEAALVGVEESAYAQKLYELLNNTEYKYTYKDAYDVDQEIVIYGLLGLAGALSDAQDELADLMNEKLVMDYTFDVDAKIAAVEGQIATEEGNLEGLKETLEDYKTIKGTSFEDWKASYEAYEKESEDLNNQLNDIKLKEAEALRATTAKQDSLDRANNAKSELKFTVSDKIAEVFANAVQSLSSPTGISTELAAFAITDAEGNVTYPNGIVLQKTKEDKGTILDGILSQIEGNVLDASDITSNKQLQAQYAAQEAGYFTADKKGTYDVALQAWKDAKAAYAKVYTDGKYYDADLNAYDVIVEAYRDYQSAVAQLDPTDDADEIDDLTEAFRKELGEYLTARKVFDGFVPKNGATELSPATKDADFTTWQGLSDDAARFGTDVQSGTTPANGGAYKAYVEACDAIGYTYDANPADENATQVEKSYEEWEENASYPEEGTNLYEKAFAAKYNNAYLTNLLNNQPEWEAMVKSLEDLATANLKEVNEATLCQNDINTEKAKIQAQFYGERAKVKQQLAGINKIMGIIEQTIKDALPSGTATTYEDAVKILDSWIIALEQGSASIDANNEATFTTDGSIPGQEAVIASYKNLLEGLKSGDYKTSEELLAKQKEDEINRKQEEIKVLQALLDSANKIKDQLMAGLTGESSGTTEVPETPEEGGEETPAE